MSALSTVDVLRGAKDVLQRNGWHQGSFVDRRPEFRGTPLAQLWAPFQVVHLPEPAAVELRVTRCCGSDACTATTLLPPGSSWLCAAHSNLLPGGGNAS